MKHGPFQVDCRGYTFFYQKLGSGHSTRNFCEILSSIVLKVSQLVSYVLNALIVNAVSMCCRNFS